MTIGPAPFSGADSAEPSYISTLRDHGIEPILVSGDADLDAIKPDNVPGLALLEAGAMSGAELTECARRCSEMRLPSIALVRERDLGDVDLPQGVDDFVVSPPRAAELVTRAQRLLGRTGLTDRGDLVRQGDLVINRVNYEVSLRGRRLNLRFKEYELLLLMATTPGKVYTREALLERIWGYDYLGGTRTVDVHIRRLRSKIEDADHTFIETVWQVGYRFRDIDGGP